MGMQHIGRTQKAFVNNPGKHFERPDHSIFPIHQNGGECKCAKCQLDKFYKSPKAS